MRKRAVGILVMLGLILLPGAGAGAAETFTFYGSGWGHGIGMSQYGAYGLAQDGWNASEILTHYYRGTTVKGREAPARRFRIGLLQSRSKVTLKAISGRVKLIRAGKTVARLGSGTTGVVRASGGRFLFSAGGSTRSLGSMSEKIRVKRSKGSQIHVSQWGYSLGRGRLELSRAGSGSMHAVAVLRPEAYLRGVAEVPSSWASATLQAQAIAARTYAFRKVAAGPKQNRSLCNCGLLGDTRDQYYAGWGKEKGSSGDRWVAAVSATKGKVVTYGGQTIPTYYSSSSGGFTENVENVWVGSASAPYLKGVCDPGDFLSANPNRTWSASFTAGQATKKLRRLTGDIGTVTGFTDYQLGVSGRVRKVKVKGTGGSKVVEGWDMRSALGLKDTRFLVDQNRNVTGKIRRKYDDLMCKPGLPTAPAADADDGRYQRFENGRLYQNGDQVVWMRGPVLDGYIAAGGHGSSLGLPLDLVKDDQGGWVGTFEGGTIACPASGACTTS